MSSHQTFYLGQPQQVAGRCVGVGDDDATVVLPEVVDANFKAFVERNGDVIHAV